MDNAAKKTDGKAGAVTLPSDGERYFVLGLFVFQVVLVGIPFPTCCLEIENKVFHIKPQLAEGLLNQRQDSSSPFCIDRHSVHKGLKGHLLVCRDCLDRVDQIQDIFGEFFLLGFGDGGVGF